MNKGTTVYLAWYDFRQQTEHVCRGEIVDNSIWADTQWRDYINVRFQPPGMSAAICRHFPADKLSEDAANVPHDDCYLVCGKKTRAFEHDYTVSATPKTSPSDTWQQVQQFKRDHWDYEHGHLQLAYIDIFYQLWRDAIAAKLGVPQNETPPVNVQYAEVAPQPSKKPAKKQKRTTGAITYQDSIQTSLFE